MRKLCLLTLLAIGACRPMPVASGLVADESKAKAMEGDGGVAKDEIDAGGGVGRPKLVEAGQIPRVARRYAFAAGKLERRVGLLSVATTLNMSGAPPQAHALPALELRLDLTPEGLRNDAFPFEVKLERIALAEGQQLDSKTVADAERQLSPFRGLIAKVDVSARGLVSEMVVSSVKHVPSGSEDDPDEIATAVTEMLQETLDLVAVPFPEEPIGVGAKWEVVRASTWGASKVTMTYRFLMKEWSGNGGVITAEVVLSSPKTPLADPRLPGAKYEVSGKGNYTFHVQLDRPTVNVSGESTALTNLEIPRSGGRPPKALLQTMVRRYSIEAR